MSACRRVQTRLDISTVALSLRCTTTKERVPPARTGVCFRSQCWVLHTSDSLICMSSSHSSLVGILHLYIDFNIALPSLFKSFSSEKTSARDTGHVRQSTPERAALA